MTKNRIDLAFQRARAANEAAFMPFLTAGDPSLEATAALIPEMERRGADLIELGIPYSDPMADGPTIQDSYTRALAGGLKLRPIFEMVRSVRENCGLPILTMVSLSIVTRFGAPEYISLAADAGIDGLIIPDLPVEESAQVTRLAAAAGLHTVFLVAPTTPEERMRRIVRRSKGFIYYVSVAGTTGARRELPPDLVDHVKAVKAVTKTPVAVGFGVSQPEQVSAIAQFADGVIVGSAIVRKVAESSDRPLPELCEKVGEFAGSLAAAKGRKTGEPK
jgi:tryptophan synthase alpha chain